MKKLAVFFLVIVLFSMVLLAHGEEKTGLAAAVSEAREYLE